MYVLKKLRPEAKPLLMKQIYNALYQSPPTYCIISWEGAYKTVIEVCHNKPIFCPPYCAFFIRAKFSLSDTYIF